MSSDSAPPVVETSLDGGVLTVTMTDVERRNALTDQMLVELTVAFDAADADPEVRAVVLTNRGSTFCAGASLSDKSSGAAAGAVRPRDLFERFARSPKPYVGRIAGHCVAGGMGLAAAMDIAIAADDVRFGFTEVRVGVAPALISVVCLPKLRPAEARAAILRGTRLSAADVERMGLILAAVPRTDLDGAIAEVTRDLLLGGPAALAASKELLATVPGMGAAEAFEWTERLSGELFASAEGLEGMAAFLEKRTPTWAARPDVPPG